ncbi:MAG: SdiA-regulated domain-containing protein [Bacteroidota bacterium]
MIRISLLLLLTTCTLCCNPSTPTATDAAVAETTAPEPSTSSSSRSAIPYSFNQPDSTWDLAPVLKEISGLTWMPNPAHLIAINDEKGQLFFIDPKEGKVTEQRKFGKAADYEGIEWVNGQIYIVQSSGTLRAVDENADKKSKAKKYKNALSQQDDVEGLGYDADKDQLLLACKSNGDKKDEEAKLVYAFDLKAKELIEPAVLRIERQAILDFLEQQGESEAIKDQFRSKMIFSPSAIAIHPISKEWYISSSVGKLLLILRPNLQIAHVVALDREVHSQPEGLCFAPDGTLWISNEGKGGKPAQIHRFTPRPQEWKKAY